MPSKHAKRAVENPENLDTHLKNLLKHHIEQKEAQKT